MIWWRVGSRPATAARTATVLPAPTSPVTTPSADSTTQKLMRAMASAWAWRGNRSLAGMDLPNGVRARPKCAAHGAALTVPLLLLVLAGRRRRACESGEVDLGSGAGGLLVGGGDQAEVVDAGGVRVRAGGLGDGAVHVAAGDERGRDSGGLAVQEHLDAGEVLGVVPQLDPPPGQRGVDGVGVAFQRDGGGAGDPAGDRPAERLPQQVRAGLAGRAAGLEPADRGLAGLGVHPAVGDLLGPRGEQVVELVQ